MCILMSFITGSSLTGTQKRMSLLISCLSRNNFSPKYFRFKRRTECLSVSCVRQKSFFTSEQSHERERLVSFSRIRKRMKVIFILSPRDNQEEKKKDSFETLRGMQLTYLCLKIKRKVIRHAFMSFSFPNNSPKEEDTKSTGNLSFESRGYKLEN